MFEGASDAASGLCIEVLGCERILDLVGVVSSDVIC